MASPAAAAAYTVTSEAELITAINTTNGNAGLDTITLGAGFTLGANLPDITDDLEVVGAGYTINGGGFTVFSMLGALGTTSLTLTGVGVTNASYGLNSDFSNVTISDSTFDDAAVEIDGATVAVTVTNSSFSNASITDGLYILATDSSIVNVSNSTANSNNTDGFDLNVETGSTLTVTNCTANDNFDEGFEMRAESASTVTATGSTADGNEGDGFALDSDTDSSITVTNSVATSSEASGFDAEATDSSTITISGSTATGSLEDALYSRASSGATISVSDSRFSASIDGFGVAAVPSEGGTIALNRITADGNSNGGVFVQDNGIIGDQSTVTITESRLADNASSGLVLFNIYYTDVVLDSSTISGNNFILGAGIFADLLADSSLTVSNSTVSGNTQLLFGAIFITPSSEATASVSIQSSTIVNNASELENNVGGVFVCGVQYVISNSILAGNTSAGAPADLDIYTAPAPTGTISYSLVQAPSPAGLVAVDAGTGNLKNVDPLLGPLANNGGLTLTHLPQDSSPVVNTGDPGTTTPALDQRRQSRVVSTIDMGAVEIQLALAATGSDAALPLAGGAALLMVAGGLLVLLRKQRSAY